MDSWPRRDVGGVYRFVPGVAMAEGVCSNPQEHLIQVALTVSSCAG
jgi:hypothetical protein